MNTVIAHVHVCLTPTKVRLHYACTCTCACSTQQHAHACTTLAKSDSYVERCTICFAKMQLLCTSLFMILTVFKTSVSEMYSQYKVTNNYMYMFRISSAQHTDSKQLSIQCTVPKRTFGDEADKELQRHRNTTHCTSTFRGRSLLVHVTLQGWAELHVKFSSSFKDQCSKRITAAETAFLLFCSSRGNAIEQCRPAERG